MPRYKVGHSYRAERDGALLGPWSKGDEIDLDESIAVFVNIDSPGALVEVKPKAAATASGRGGRP